MSSTVISRKLVERTIGGKLISIETGHLAKQASGAVVVRIGDTMTLVATVAGPGREGLDFFPLTVDYREKIYAAGKFPGGFIKREGRPTTKEILTSRLIDRPIRPLFPEWYRDEVQIQAGPISADRQNDPDVPSIIGASASLDAPEARSMGPIGAIRLGRVDGKLVAFPTADEMENSDLDLVVASTDKADRDDRRVRRRTARARDGRRDHGGPPLNQEVIAASARPARGRWLAHSRARRDAGRPAPADALRPLRPSGCARSSRSSSSTSGTRRPRSCSSR